MLPYQIIDIIVEAERNFTMNFYEIILQLINISRIGIYFII